MHEEQTQSIHGEWSSRLGFILAATGSAVGLGNIWKFPYIAGEYGGGAFVIAYLLCIALIGLPVMMAEVMLGRLGRLSPINTMRKLASDYNRPQIWQIIGWSGVIAGFIILSYYSVVAGWALAYIPRLGAGFFGEITQLSATTANEYASTIFGNLISDPERLLAWHTLFMVGTVWMIAGGVQGGLERTVRFMMPSLFLLLLILLGYAMSTEQFMQGIHFMFDVNFHQLFYAGCKTVQADCAFNASGILAALGQAFFTLSLGMGAIMIYGAYLPKSASIPQTTTIIVCMDTLVAILAGMVIFPIVFSNGLAPDAGPGLVFNTLPIAFGQMPFGTFFGVLFFVLLGIAAWSSAISIIEPVVAWLMDSYQLNRLKAAILCGIAAWALGFLTIASFNIWSEIKPIAGMNAFELLEFLTTNIMLPLGGLLIAVFVAWFLPQAVSAQELNTQPNALGYKIWLFLLRYVTPLGIGLILINGIM